MKFEYIIAGASQAGLQAAQAIRGLKPECSLLILDKEGTWPYKRTKLSKNLQKPMNQDSWLLHEKQWYSDMNIDLRTGERITAVDPGTKTVKTEAGSVYHYSKLLLATGSRSFHLPVSGSEYILTLRNKTDASVIIEKLKTAKSVVIVGQGVEGMEMAEQACLAGKQVTVTGQDSRIMERWFNEEYSQKMKDLYESKGVRFLFNSRCRQVIKNRSGFDVVTDSGVCTADLVLGSTGIEANRDYLPSPDEPVTSLQTKWNDIYAAGDILSLPPEYSPGLWHAAEEQGKAAGRLMAGEKGVLSAVPYRLKTEVFGSFWYSQGYSTLNGLETESVLLNTEGKNITTWTDSSGQVKAVLMRGLPERGKALQSLVRKGCQNREILDLINEPLK